MLIAGYISKAYIAEYPRFFVIINVRKWFEDNFGVVK